MFEWAKRIDRRRLRDRLNPLRPPEYAVLSLEAEARRTQTAREQGRFEVLVRHLLNRFLNHELIATDGETTRAVQLGYVIALPGLMFALYLFPSYHSPLIPRRLFWPQAGDHYFFVVYAMVLMGVVTVYEWDLLFPDLLDVFVLSSLPIAERRLFAARVSAVGIFLGMVLIGVNSLGAIFMPLVADLPSLRVHLAAHFAAIALGGIFAAASCLAVQGVLLNVMGERMFRRITPLLQGGSIMILLTTLFLFPAFSGSLEALLRSGSGFVRWFPPFWFLGIYERVLGGSGVLPIFNVLAITGCWATGGVLALVAVTYPLAYRRRVRQLIEGSGTMDMRSWGEGLAHRVLHTTVLRVPARRAIFHFISQTLLRTQRHRVLLAMYGGVGVAIALAGMMSLTIVNGRVGIGFTAEGVRAVVPVLIFWTVMGLRTALAAPVDRRGSWIFRVIGGRASLEQLKGAKVWVIVWGCVVSGAAGATLYRLVGTRGFIVQVVAGLGMSLLLTDCLFLRTMALPFTGMRRASITDMPWVVVRYFVAFPVLVFTLVSAEGWIEAHLFRTVLYVLGAHLLWGWRYGVRVKEMRLGSDFEEDDGWFQELGLRG